MNSIVIAPDITYLRYIINKSSSYDKLFFRSLSLSSFFYSCFIYYIYIQECENRAWYDFALRTARHYGHPLIQQSLDRASAVAILPHPYIRTKFDKKIKYIKNIFHENDILKYRSILKSIDFNIYDILEADSIKVALFSNIEFTLLFD